MDPNANNQLTVCKMFLGGLKDDTTEEMVRAALSEYGTIKEVEMINDKNTGKIKGFCFVTFDDYDPVDKLVLKRRILLNTRNVEVKKAFAKGESDRMAMRMGMGPPGPMPMSRGGRGDYPGGYNRDYDSRYYGYHGGPGMGNNYNGAWQGPPIYGDNYYPRAYNFGNHGGAFNGRR